MDDKLGPFQEIWNAWDEADPQIKGKPITHFRKATDVQFDEIDAHLAAGDREATAREAVDVISIALNVLRWLDYSPDQIAELAQGRARNRMSGQALEILEKYSRNYDI